MQKMTYALAALLLAFASFCSTSLASASTRAPEDSFLGYSDSTNVINDPPSRIIGGNTSQISDAPWQVALIRASESSDSQGQFCGGSVYNSRWIITAAHCLVGFTPSSIRVLAGTDILPEFSLSNRRVAYIYVHPGYNPQTFANDIGLIQLYDPLPLQPGIIEPISLPTSAPKPMSTALITGWGALTRQGDIYPYELQKAHVVVNTDKNCSTVYKTAGGYDAKLMMCANTPDFKIDTCYGDSGGPLAVYVSGRWELHGVTSFGIACAQAPYPGVYAETYSFITWIKSKAGEPPALPFSSAPAPVITGLATVGQTLTASISGWSPTPTSVSYQWLRSGSTTAIATGPSYTLTSSDLGKTITVRVTGGAPGYASTIVTSNQTSAVILGQKFSSAPAPVITGLATVGQTLSAAISGWSPTPTSVSYQWLRSGSPTAVATGPSYTLTSDDLGKTITVRVTGGAQGYASTTVISVARGPVTPGSFTSTPDIAITGSTVVGKNLNVSFSGGWIPTQTSVSYQWFRSGSTTAVATGNSYTLTSDDLGKTITVKATGVRPGYVSTTVNSVASDPVTLGFFSSTPAPVISGYAVVGWKLTASIGWNSNTNTYDWGPAPTSMTYQWFRSGSTTPIASGPSYTVTSTDMYKTITVKATGVRPGYASTTVISSGIYVWTP